MPPLRVADRWFQVTRFDGGVTLLTEPHVHAAWRSNVWLVRGRDSDVLVDAGMGIGDLAGELQPMLDKPLIAFATHRHSDHIGGLHAFNERLAHEQDAAAIAEPGPASIARADYADSVIAFMEKDGGPIGEYFIDAIPAADYDPALYAVAGAPATRIVAEGDVVDLGDRAFEVLHLPGHTPGSIALWSEADGLLFSGDAIYDGLLYDFLPESSIPDYVETMRRLRGLPVSAVHGGHGASFGRARMVEIIDDYIRRRGG